MIVGFSKKVIYLSFLFVSFIQPSKSVDIYKINNNKYNLISNPSWSKSNNHNLFFRSSILSFKDNSEFFNFDKNFSNQIPDPLFAANNNQQKELIIQADKQSEINNIINAEGNVSVSYNGKFLKADNLIYDKLNKKITAKGNIDLILGDQIFQVSQFEYSFISEKGFLLDVKGSINTNTLLDDLSPNFNYQILIK